MGTYTPPRPKYKLPECVKNELSRLRDVERYYMDCKAKKKQYAQRNKELREGILVEIDNINISFNNEIKTVGDLKLELAQAYEELNKQNKIKEDLTLYRNVALLGMCGTIAITLYIITLFVEM